MKQVITILFLVTLLNSITHASDSIRYSGQDNFNKVCHVDVYNRKAGRTIAISSDSGSYEFGYGYSLDWGTFPHCKDDFLKINRVGDNRLILFCGEHNNEGSTTKGHAEIIVINGYLNSAFIKGYYKKPFRSEFSLDVNLVCKNLQKVN